MNTLKDLETAVVKALVVLDETSTLDGTVDLAKRILQNALDKLKGGR